MDIIQNSNSDKFLYKNYFLGFLIVSPLISSITTLINPSIDIVKFMISICLLDFLWTSNRKVDKHVFNLSLLLIFFYLYILFSLTYSPSTNYKFDKYFNSFGNIIFFLYPLSIQNLNYNILKKVLIFIVVPITLIFYTINFTYNNIFFNSLVKFNYLLIGFHLGVLIILLFTTEFRNKYFKYFIILLLLISSARGSIIFIFIILLILFFKNYKKINIRYMPKKIIYYPFIFFSIIFIIYNYFEFYFQRTIFRFSNFATGIDNSSLQRLNFMKFAFHESFENISYFLWGHGFGSFGVFYFHIDERSYPHNLFIELFFELGIIGLFLFLFIIFYNLRFFKINNFFSLLLVFSLFNSMKSGNFSDQWIMFLSLGGLISDYKKNIISSEAYASR